MPGVPELIGIVTKCGSNIQEFAKGKLKEMGYRGFLAGFFSKGIPRLERWKKQ